MFLSSTVSYFVVCLFSVEYLRGARCDGPLLWPDHENFLHLLSFERKCYRKILRIGWTQKITNEELYRKIQLAKTLLQKVIQRKLRLFGHICRMDDSRKIKTLVFGMMDGSNKRGRPHRKWSDDIEQWCGATLQE